MDPKKFCINIEHYTINIAHTLNWIFKKIQPFYLNSNSNLFPRTTKKQGRRCLWGYIKIPEVHSGISSISSICSA